MCSFDDLKRSLLPVLQESVKSYDLVLKDRHSLIVCDDGYKVDALWRKSHFMHLCGVRCNRPPRLFNRSNKAGRPGEAEYFYDRLLTGDLSLRELVITDSHLVRRKSVALPLLSKIAELDLDLVEAKKEYLTLALGDRKWLVGFASDAMESELCDGPVLFPRTLRLQAVNRIAQADAVVRHVEQVTFVPELADAGN